MSTMVSASNTETADRAVRLARYPVSIESELRARISRWRMTEAEVDEIVSDALSLFAYLTDTGDGE